MKEKINVAEILKDKPQETKLYDWLYNIDVELDTISTTDTETVVWCTNETDNNTTCHRGYSEFGTVRGCNDGLQILLPSKKMRDWRKFLWKKGDVLQHSEYPLTVIFDSFEDDTYTSFKCKYCFNFESASKWLVSNSKCSTKHFYKVSEEEAKEFIRKVELNYNGKLKMETLEIEKSQPEFNDGDIVALETRYIDSKDVIVETFIVRGGYNYGDNLKFYAACSNNTETDVVYNSSIILNKTSTRKESFRLATEKEKQQLFDALTKEGKAWDAEKKTIVDLEPNVRLKPFDKVLVRDSKSDKWRANLFGYIGKDRYYCCVYANWRYCIPYKGNEHLLGTTKDVEG